jgi:hypothetical protein
MSTEPTFALVSMTALELLLMVGFADPLTGGGGVWSFMGAVAVGWRGSVAAGSLAGSGGTGGSTACHLSLETCISASFSLERVPTVSLDGASVKGSTPGLVERWRRFLLKSKYAARPRKPAPKMLPIASPAIIPPPNLGLFCADAVTAWEGLGLRLEFGFKPSWIEATVTVSVPGGDAVVRREDVLGAEEEDSSDAVLARD